MALNFNPFEKGTGAPTPKTKRNHSHYRVFDDPTKSSTPPEQEQQPAEAASLKMNDPSFSRSETEAQSRPNKGPIEYKPGTEPRPNKGPIEADPEYQSKPKIQNRGQIEYKPGTEPRPHSRSNRVQIEAKPGTEPRPTRSISSIDGLQREILILIFDHCKRLRSKQTPPIAVEHITENCKTTYHAARKAIQRLEQKGILKRVEFKVGRSGWTKYEIHDATYQELLQNETEANSRPIRGRIEYKPGTEPRPEPRPSASSSSSSLKDLETTTTDEASKDLNPAWAEIDGEPLNEIRFGRSHVAQLARGGCLTPEELQDSIYAFAFDLEHNGKAKGMTKPPLNYFMGILRKGPYAAPANYEPPGIRQMRLYLEAKEREQKVRAELEARLETAEFEEWLEKLSLAKRAELIPPKDFAKPGSTAHNVQLREYFRQAVWPEFREKIAKEPTV